MNKYEINSHIPPFNSLVDDARKTVVNELVDKFNQWLIDKIKECGYEIENDLSCIEKFAKEHRVDIVSFLKQPHIKTLFIDGNEICRWSDKLKTHPIEHDPITNKTIIKVSFDEV